VTIFFGVGTISIPILEVDTEIFYRLALQLAANPLVDCVERRMILYVDRVGERRRVRCLEIHRSQRESAELGDRVRGEKLGAAVDSVHRLASSAFTRMRSCERKVRFTKRGRGICEFSID
jgi:hypothetical protein